MSSWRPWPWGGTRSEGLRVGVTEDPPLPTPVLAQTETQIPDLLPIGQWSRQAAHPSACPSLPPAERRCCPPHGAHPPEGRRGADPALAWDSGASRGRVGVGRAHSPRWQCGISHRPPRQHGASGRAGTSSSTVTSPVLLTTLTPSPSSPPLPLQRMLGSPVSNLWRQKAQVLETYGFLGCHHGALPMVR